MSAEFGRFRSVKGYILCQTCESMKCCHLFVPLDENRFGRTRFLIPVDTCSVPIDNPFVIYDVDLVRRWTDRESDEYVVQCINSIRSWVEQPPHTVLMNIISARCEIQPDVAALSHKAISGRLLELRESWSESAEFGLIGSLFLVSKTLFSDRATVALLRDFHVDFISKLSPVAVAFLYETYNRNKPLLYFWQDFLHSFREIHGCQESQQLRVPLELLWDSERSMCFDSSVPKLQQCELPAANRHLLNAAIDADVRARKRSLHNGDILYEGLEFAVFDFTLTIRLGWSCVQVDSSESGKSVVWERGQSEFQHKRLIEYSRLFNAVYGTRAEELVNREEAFHRPDGKILDLVVLQTLKSDVAKLAAKLLENGFYLMTAAASATDPEVRMRNSFNLCESASAGEFWKELSELNASSTNSRKKIAVFWAHRMCAAELNAILNPSCGVAHVMLIGDPCERGPPYLRGECGSHGGGEPFRNLLNRYAPFLIPSEDQIRKAIFVAQSAKRLVVRASGPIKLSTTIRNLKKAHKGELVFACCGSNSAELRDVVLGSLKSNWNYPRFTHSFYLTDRSELVEVNKVVDHHSSATHEIEILKREESLQTEVYRIQYFRLPSEFGRTKKSYRKMASVISLDNGTKLDTNIFELSADGGPEREIAEALVESATVDGSAIECKLVYRHERISPNWTDHIVHVCGVGSTLEDVYATLKYCEKLTVVFSENSVASLIELPILRTLATSSLPFYLGGYQDKTRFC